MPRGRRPLEPPALTRTNALSGAYPPARRRSADEAEGDGRGVEERRARRRPRRSTARARRAGGEDPQITLNGPRSLEREQGTSAEEQRQNRSAGPAATPPDYPRTRSRASHAYDMRTSPASAARGNAKRPGRSGRPPVRRGARPGARVERRIVWRMRRTTSGTCPFAVAEGRSRTGIRDVTILFDTVATLKVPPTTWVRRSALLQCSRGPRRSIDARAPHIVSCAGANGGTGEPAL